jgi:polysaccharide biosynthesis protein PelD
LGKKKYTDSDIEKIGNYPKFLGIRVSAWIEIALFFIILLIIAWLFHIPINYRSVCPHPFWIIVILMAAQYGTNEGLLAAIVATIIFLLGPYPERVLTQDKFQYVFMIAKGPVLWFVAAVILGEIRNRHIRELLRVKEVALSSQEREKTVTKAYSSLKEIKEQLEIRYASQMQTAITAYDSFKRLEKEDKPGIIKGALELVRTFVSPEKMSLFLLGGDELKLIASEGWKEGEPFKKEIPSTSALFQEIVAKKRVLSVVNSGDREILEPEGALAVPIINTEKNALFGMIKIEQIPFLRLRKATIETCRTIGEWIGAAWGHSIETEQALEGQFISPTSGLLTPSFLKFQTRFLTELCKRLKTSVTHMHITLKGAAELPEEKRQQLVTVFRTTINELLRSVDQAFEYGKHDGEFSILLINTDLTNSEIVRKKILAALESKLDKTIHITCIATPLYEE